MQEAGGERGYLKEKFRLFHIRDQRELRVDWHYHAFEKLVFFVSGRARYDVESQSSPLQPGDLVVVARGQLHRMRAEGDTLYDRVILYLDGAYLRSLAPEAGGLDKCFRLSQSEGRSLLRLPEPERATAAALLARMERALNEDAPYAAALSEALLAELLVLVCRAALRAPAEDPSPDAPAGEQKMAEAMRYIQANPGADLSCDALAKRLHMSRSSFQHRFREATGYPPHAYVRLKRLLYASELLLAGTPALRAGQLAGYGDHSAFCHAFAAQFGVPPSLHRQSAALSGPEE